MGGNKMRDRIGNMLWGIVFIIIGVGFLGNVLWGWHFELFFDGWWTLFIIVPCAISMVQRGPRTGNMIGMAIGVYLLLSQYYNLYHFGELIVPAILIILGVRIIFKNNRLPNHRRDNDSYHSTQSSYSSDADGQEEYSQHVYNKEYQQRGNDTGNQATAIF
jgi:hypothetical protein